MVQIKLFKDHTSDMERFEKTLSESLRFLLLSNSIRQMEGKGKIRKTENLL